MPIDLGIHGAHGDPVTVPEVVTDRAHGPGWRSDLVLVTDETTLTTQRVCNADTFLVDGVQYKWTVGASTSAPNKAITGVTSGAYVQQTAAAFVPPSIASAPCVLQLDARLGVSATSTDVDTWADQSGNGNNATQTSDARPTLLATGWSDGGPCVSFNGSADWLAADGVLPHIQGAQPKSLAVLFRLSATPASSCIFGAGGAGSTLLALQGATTNLNVFNRPAEATTVSGNQAIGLAATRDQLLVLTHVDGANNTKCWFEGKEYVFTEDLFQNTYLWTHAAIGATLSGGVTAANFFAGKMRTLELYSGALTSADYVTLCKRLLGRKYVNVVCDGNSLTVSQGATGGFTYPGALKQAIWGSNASISPANATAAVGGQTTPQMIARFPTYVAPLVRAHATNVLVAWEVTNDIVINGDTYSASTNDTTWANEVAAAVVANYWEYCALGRAAGYIVIGVTGTDRVGFSAKQRAAMNAANALIVAQYASRIDGLVRVDLRTQLMVYANTNYFSDGTHYTNAGYGIVAQDVATEITRVLTARGL